MSLAQLRVPRGAKVAGLAGMLALPLLAGCVYDDGYGYYDPSPGYDYGYGYGYGYYGNPCWPYGCGGWGHRHRHHHWDDDNDDDGGQQHRRGNGIGGVPRVDPGRQANGQPDGGNTVRIVPGRGNKSPTAPNYWIPTGRDSKP